MWLSPGLRLPELCELTMWCVLTVLHETAEECFQWFAGNSKHIQSLVALAMTLYDCLEQDGRDKPAAAQILTVNDFLFSKGLDNLNLFRLIRFVPTPRLQLLDCVG